jgi:hypothetical protein
MDTDSSAHTEEVVDVRRLELTIPCLQGTKRSSNNWINHL